MRVKSVLIGLVGVLLAASASAQGLPDSVAEPYARYRAALEAGDAGAAASAARAAFEAGETAGLDPATRSTLAWNIAYTQEAEGDLREAVSWLVRAAEIAEDGGLDGVQQAQALNRASLLSLQRERPRDANRYARGAGDAIDRVVETYGGYPADALELALEVRTMMAQAAWMVSLPVSARESASMALQIHAAAGRSPDALFVRLSKIAGTTAVMAGDFEDAWVDLTGAAAARDRLDPEADDLRELRAWASYADQFLDEDDKARLGARLEARGLITPTSPCPDGPDGCEPIAAAHQCAAEDFADAEPRMRVQIEYPRSATASGAGGFALAEFDIDSAGRIVNPEVLVSVPHATFDDAVLRGLRRWRYEPATCAGAAIERRDVVVFFNFMLDGSEDDPGEGWRLEPS